MEWIERYKNRELKSGQKLEFLNYSKLFKYNKLQIQELAKVVSAMANAVGGKILIGLNVNCGVIVGEELVPMGFPDKEILMEEIQSVLMPEVPNLLITKTGEVLEIDVPESLLKPHMFSNYKYYKRVKAKNTVLEEFEIRQLYQQGKKSDLQIIGFTNLQGIPNMSNGLIETMRFYPRVHIRNLGHKMESQYKLEIKIPSVLVDENLTVLHPYLKGYEQDYNIYSIPSKDTLYQGESQIIVELVLKLTEDIFDIFENAKMIFNLYSKEQVHSKELLCSEWFHYQGKLLLKENFRKKLKF